MGIQRRRIKHPLTILMKKIDKKNALSTFSVNLLKKLPKGIDMQRISFCVLVLAHLSLFGAAEPEQQLRKRTSPTTLVMSEKTKTIMKNHTISATSNPSRIEEVAHHVSDGATNNLIGGCVIGALDAYGIYQLSEGCAVVPASEYCALLSIASAASLFCLANSYQNIKSSRELFILADAKKNN